MESRNVIVDALTIAQRLRLQANHDNPSWTWKMDNHGLASVLSLWIRQNTKATGERKQERRN
nr:hypothetical protein [Ferrimicrobium acidiphilum]